VHARHSFTDGLALEWGLGVFGVNSNRKKPGKKGVEIESLLFWEHEWYAIFHGLAFGLPERGIWQSHWEPIPPPAPTGDIGLYSERVREWEEKRKTSAGSKYERYRVSRPGIQSEIEVWNQIKDAGSSAALISACDNSAFWLNPKNGNKPYVVKLRENANEFLKSKCYRYPNSDRPSSETKRVLHFARAMAGIMEGIGPIRALDLIRLRKHGARCGCVVCEIQRRRKMAKGPLGIIGLS
jgi:hypothetical protein